VKGNLSGYVVRGETPVADATITIVRGQGSHPDVAPLSDADGWFALDALDPGLWRLRADAPDGSSGEADVDVWPDSLSELTISLDPVKTTVPRKSGTGRKSAGRKPQPGFGRVVGRVTDSATGEAVVGAPVVVTDGPGPLPDLAFLTDEHGEFVIPEIAAGDWVLRVDADGLGQGMLMVGVVGDRSVSVALALIPESTNGYWT